MNKEIFDKIEDIQCQLDDLKFLIAAEVTRPKKNWFQKKLDQHANNMWELREKFAELRGPGND